MDPEEALELAQQAVKKVSHIAISVGQKKQRSVCGRLGGELFIVADYLDGLSNQVDQLSKVPKLLRDIERICCWPELPKDDYYPCLRGIANAIYGTNTYRQAEASIIKGVTKITAGNGEEAEKAIMHIRRFTKRGGIKKQKTEEISNSKSMPVDHLDDAKEIVYQTLKKHVRCTCDCGMEDKIEHSANLLLTVTFENHEGNALFNMLFSSDPSRDRLMNGRWQDVRLSVSHSKGDKKRQKRARFDDITDYTERCSEEVKDGKFCKLIRQGENHASLCFMVHDGKLHRLLDSEPLQHIVDHTPGISLANVIQSYYLTPKVKTILAYILARSIWQFYDSDWLKTPWTSRTIQFMKHYTSPLGDDEPSIFPSKPYYSVHFGEDDVTASEATTNSGEIHRYPRVRDLGIMLVEIGLGCLLNGSAPTHNDAFKISKVNQEWLQAKGWSDSKNPWRDFDYPKYRGAVENCLDPNIFAKAPFKPSVNVDELAKGLHKRRKIFYENVVSPLEDLVQGTGWKDSVHSMPSLRLQAPTTQQPQTLEELGPPLERAKIPKDQKNAKKWLKRIQLLNRELKLLSQGPVRRARIAILDTGYDADAVFFHPNARRNRLVKWKDWVENAKEPTDCNGHGTHLVSLIMKIAPEADIYVARVAKDPMGLNDASEAIAKAIEWASECDANIISMSFGFPATQPSISKAIRKAVNDHDDSIIFFAAAANSGLNESEMFPARHECVISIRATNSNGAFQDFNPPRSSHGGTVIGTLGLDVPSSGLSHEAGDVYRKGTSVSTAVAAGMAGMLLGYVESNAGRSTYCDVKKSLWTREGMLALFETMSPPPKDGQIYVVPWALAGLDDDRRWAKLGALV